MTYIDHVAAPSNTKNPSTVTARPIEDSANPSNDQISTDRRENRQTCAPYGEGNAQGNKAEADHFDDIYQREQSQYGHQKRQRSTKIERGSTSDASLVTIDALNQESAIAASESTSMFAVYGQGHSHGDARIIEEIGIQTTQWLKSIANQLTGSAATQKKQADSPLASVNSLSTVNLGSSTSSQAIAEIKLQDSTFPIRPLSISPSQGREVNHLGNTQTTSLASTFNIGHTRESAALGNIDSKLTSGENITVLPLSHSRKVNEVVKLTNEVFTSTMGLQQTTDSPQKIPNYHIGSRDQAIPENTQSNTGRAEILEQHSHHHASKSWANLSTPNGDHAVLTNGSINLGSSGAVSNYGSAVSSGMNALGMPSGSIAVLPMNVPMHLATLFSSHAIQSDIYVAWQDEHMGSTSVRLSGSTQPASELAASSILQGSSSQVDEQRGNWLVVIKTQSPQWQEILSDHSETLRHQLEKEMDGKYSVDIQCGDFSNHEPRENVTSLKPLTHPKRHDGELNEAHDIQTRPDKINHLIQVSV